MSGRLSSSLMSLKRMVWLRLTYSAFRPVSGGGGGPGGPACYWSSPSWLHPCALHPAERVDQPAHAFGERVVGGAGAREQRVAAARRRLDGVQQRGERGTAGRGGGAGCGS